MAENKENKEKSTDQPTQVIGDPYKYVPKFCTSVNFAVVNNNKVLITLTYQENNTQPPTLIERVIVDLEHAHNIAKVLEEVLKKVKKDESASTIK